MTHEYYMQEALKQASLAYEQEEIPVGAVIVAENRIIAKAHNQSEQLNDVTAHAEILAITAASNYLGAKYLNQCTLYVTLEPCVMCAGAIFWAQFATVVYGAMDEKRGYRRCQVVEEKRKTKTSKKYSEPVSILHPKTQVITGILENECQEILLKFFQKLRN